MRQKRVCDDLIIESGVKLGGLAKSFIAVVIVGILVWFFGWGKQMIPAFSQEAVTGEEEETSDYFDDVDYSTAEISLDYARNQLSADKTVLYDTILESLLNKEFTIVNGLDGFTSDEVSDVVNMVNYDHPELCWFDGSCSVYSDLENGNVSKLVFTDEYGLLCDEAQIDYIQAQAENAAADIIAKAQTYSTDYEKAIYVHDELINRITYNTELAERRESGNDSDEDDLQASMYGALVNNSTICQGYAQAYEYIMKELGIECAFVVGTANGGGHGWNLINLDGSYYYVDLTWDDPVSPEDESDTLWHAYCFVSSETLSKDHTVDDSIVFYPVCTATDCNYYVKNGMYFDTYSYSSVKESIVNSIKSDKLVELNFGSTAEMEKAVSDLCDNGGFSDILSELGYADTQHSYSKRNTLLYFEF